MSRLDIWEAIDLYKSVDSLRRVGTLTPTLLADFIYNRKDKLVGKLTGFGGEYKNFDACEVQFRSLIDLDAYHYYQKNPTSGEIALNHAEEIAKIAEKAFAEFATWTWSIEKK